MLSMALWKAVSDRYELLLATWDSGRVGPDRAAAAGRALIWGRLDAAAAASGLAVSLPEACRLSDALVGPAAGPARARPVRAPRSPTGSAQLRAQMERIRDQVDLEPAGPAQQARGRTPGPAGPPAEGDRRQGRPRRRRRRAARPAGDRGGHLRARPDRRRRARRDAARTGPPGPGLRADLEAREAALRTAGRAVPSRTVDPAPRYAVPDVDALGPVPNTAGPAEPRTSSGSTRSSGR